MQFFFFFFFFWGLKKVVQKFLTVDRLCEMALFLGLGKMEGLRDIYDNITFLLL